MKITSTETPEKEVIKVAVTKVEQVEQNIAVVTTTAPVTTKVVSDAPKPPSIVIQSEKAPSETVDLTKYDYVPQEKRQDAPVPVNSLRFSSSPSARIKSPAVAETAPTVTEHKVAPVLHKQPNLTHFDPATAFAFAQQTRMGQDAKQDRKPPKLVQQPKAEPKDKFSVVQRGSIMSGTPIRRIASPLQRNQPASLYPPGLDRALKEGLILFVWKSA